MLIKLALRNLVGAGLRTWLNVFILSIAYVVIIWHYGLIDGWNRQARNDTIEWQVGGGQIWHEKYDPFDPFTFFESHAPIPESWKKEIEKGRMTPILVTQATCYLQGRMTGVLLKGIEPDQKVLRIPSHQLKKETDALPVLIGTRTQRALRLNEKDRVILRWRDVHGTFDAMEAEVIGIFQTTVQAVDNGQMYCPIERLWKMMDVHQEATFFVMAKHTNPPQTESVWVFKDLKFLLADSDRVIRQKYIGGAVLYLILLGLSMLAIFDTQVLSIFKRQKEIGTQIALGMTRGQVIFLFTIEGALHAVLAGLMGALYGIPLLSIQAIHGFSLPEATEGYGITVSEKIFPVYSVWLILATVGIVFFTATLVSYLPSRKIAKMKPTEAIRGKIQ